MKETLLSKKSRIASILILALFAICSIIIATTLIKTYAQATETVYMSEIMDSKGIYDFSHKVHIFKPEYGDYIKSHDGSNVVAPFSKNSFTLNVNNDTGASIYYYLTANAIVTGDVPVRYECPQCGTNQIALTNTSHTCECGHTTTVTPSAGTPASFPISLSLSIPGGWSKSFDNPEDIGKAGRIYYKIDKSHIDTFKYDWKWETVSDEEDTLWSQSGAEIDIYLEIGIDKDCQEIMISFDAGEGSLIGESSKIVYVGSTYGELPSASRSGYIFLGWMREDGTVISPESVIEEKTDTMFHAKWQKHQSSKGGGGGVGSSIEDDNFHLPIVNGIYGYTSPGGSYSSVSTGEWILEDPQKHIWRFKGKVLNAISGNIPNDAQTVAGDTYLGPSYTTTGIIGYARDGWYRLLNPYSKTGGATDAQWFHFNKNGIMDYGWFLAEDGRWYYLNETINGDFGKLEYGWYYDNQDKRTYYLDLSTGEMYYGWHKIDGYWYYFAKHEDITAQTTWVFRDNVDGASRWIYVSNSRSYGSMYSGEYTPDGKFVNIDGTWNKAGPEPVAEPQKMAAPSAITYKFQ